MNRRIFGIVIAMVLMLSPICVKASTTYATSEDGSKTYTSIDSAWSAAQSGVSIVMQCDWNISSRLILDENKTATIEMNGHKISRNLTSTKTNGEVIILEEKSKLTLNGSKASNTTFTVDGYTQEDGTTKVKITSGGLITGGSSTNGAGGIHMHGGSTLVLNSVAVSGNYSEESWGSDGRGGGVYMNGDYDTLVMTNKAQISYNRASKCGGGVYVDDKHSTIDMTDSQISYNYTDGDGSGIYSFNTFTTIKLDNSCIDHNVAKNRSAIYFCDTDFEVISEKNNGYIRHNTFLDGGDGGAINASESPFTQNKGLIKGITFIGNEGKTAGGVYVDQENITISNCTFKDNTAYKGSAIFVDNDGFILENSTIESNTTTAGSSGAVAVDSMNDITLKGKIVIKNNPNTITKVDSDLYLQTGLATDAYILGAPDSSSTIGITKTGTRVIAKNQNASVLKCYSITNNEFGKYELTYDDSAKTISLVEGNHGVIIAGTNTQNDLNLEEPLVDGTEATVATDLNTHTVTLNKVNESGSWSETETITVHDGEFLDVIAPSVEDRTFVEYRDVPESITVEEGALKADSLNEDVTVTVVYTDTESEGSATEQIHTVTLNIALEDGTILNTEQMEFSSLDAFELLAPIAEGKTFVEWKDVPEGITVEGETLKADTLTSDIEVTAVYNEAQGESSETGSIFGKGSSTVALVVVIILATIGGYTYFKKKNK